MDELNGAFIRLGDFVLVLAKVARTAIDFDLIVNVPPDQIPEVAPLKIHLTEAKVENL